MASLYVSEYDRLFDEARGIPLIAPREPAIATQTPITISGSTAQSAAFDGRTRYVRVHTDAVCHVTFGGNPTATTNDARMAADQTEYFSVKAGDRLAVIQGS